jgi:murein DD-endopeptidase MepM/ murein hydrolase activator NlpD
MSAAYTVPDEYSRSGLRIDGLALAALLLIFFIVGQLLLDRNTADETRRPQEEEARGPVEPVAPQAADPYALSYPYDTYWLTQGVHGAAYGHAAIDLAAGKGATVNSPLDGQVTANFVDGYGNTRLVIENEIYRVTLLHGNYSAAVGQSVARGDPVGVEGNNGYTTDMQGRSCRNRDCGYHSHLNIFSKEQLANVNPLDVLH